MKLSAYLTHVGKTQRAFAEDMVAAARRLGLDDVEAIPPQTVSRYCAGAIPRPLHGRLIFLASEGAVTPNDFYDLPVLPREGLPVWVHAAAFS